MKAVRIRRMMCDDASRIAAAFADMNKTLEQYERYWQENLEGTRLTLLAELHGEVAGYANLIWEPDYAPFRRLGIPEIHDMNTVTALRRNGIGTKMIAAAEELVRASGIGTIGIGVGATADYAIAQSLYPRLGYVPDGTGVHPDEWGGCIYLTKPLDRTRTAQTTRTGNA